MVAYASATNLRQGSQRHVERHLARVLLRVRKVPVVQQKIKTRRHGKLGRTTKSSVPFVIGLPQLFKGLGKHPEIGNIFRRVFLLIRGFDQRASSVA